MVKGWSMLCLGLLVAAAHAQAALHTERVEYRHGETVLEGYLAYDDAIQGKRPGCWWSMSGKGWVRMRCAGLSSSPGWATWRLP